jgi:type I restriction enzyme R subunit
MKTEMLVCSLVHKFGRKSDEGDFESYIEELKASLGSNFEAKGDIYVFVDECHRTQSGSYMMLK